MEMRQEHKPCEVKENGALYKIGMFAAMNHVTVKTLRFYEEQGLLTPALIHPETGYRYYTLSQMAVLHQITALKLAGFTLEEIALLNGGADEESLLLKKKSQLLAKIAELTRQIAVVDGYLSQKKTRLSAPVLIKTIPETTVACLRTRLETYDCLFDRMPEMGTLMEKAGCTCALPAYCFTNYLEPGYKDGEILVELCESVAEAKQEIGDLRFRTLPAVQAACVFHKGCYRTFSEYNGPQEIDHLFPMNREHGKINQRKREESILCHEGNTHRNLRPRSFWRYSRESGSWEPLLRRTI